MNSGKTLLIFLCTHFFINGIFAQKFVQAQSISERNDFDVTELQTSIVAHLTGHSDESPFTARSTPHERNQTAKYLSDTFEQLNLSPIIHRYTMPNVNGFVDLILAPYKGQNVYSIVESTESSKEYVLVGAHYDTEPEVPGAIDNAAGVSIVLTLSKLINQQKYRKYNYIFVLFDQEEDDEVGSKSFAQFLQSKPFKIHSTHVLDVIGWGESDTLAYTVQVSDDFIETMYRKTASDLSIQLNVFGGRGHSDNKSFNLAGYHSAGFWDDELTPHIHKPTDTFETVNFDRLKLATHFMFELLTNLDSNHDEL